MPTVCTAVVEPPTKRRSWSPPLLAARQAGFGETTVPHLLLLLNSGRAQWGAQSPCVGALLSIFLLPVWLPVLSSPNPQRATHGEADAAREGGLMSDRHLERHSQICWLYRLSPEADHHAPGPSGRSRLRLLPAQLLQQAVGRDTPPRDRTFRDSCTAASRPVVRGQHSGPGRPSSRSSLRPKHPDGS